MSDSRGHALTRREAHRIADATYALPERGFCPTPTKEVYPTRREAKKALKVVKRRIGGHIGVYLCGCGRFHLGKLPERHIAGGRP